MHPEFQAVVLCGPGIKLYPICDNDILPKPLIPIAGKPLISNILTWLEDEGLFSARRAHAKISAYLQKGYAGSLHLEIFVQEDESDEGTIDAMLHVKPYLKTDFLLLPCDLIFKYPFKPIADMFRLERPYCLIVFYKESPLGSEGVKQKPSDQHNDLNLLDSSESRLLQIESLSTREDELTVPLHIISQFPHIKAFTNLVDTHFYVFNPAVLGLLSQLRSNQVAKDLDTMVSFREEFIPWLVSRQFFRRSFTLDDEELVVLGGDQDISFTEENALTGFSSFKSRCVYNEVVASSETESGSFKCFAFISNSHIPDCDSYIPPIRVNSISAFVEANRRAVKMTPPNSRISPSAEIGAKTQIGQDSLICDKVIIGERCSIKKSIINQNCTLGMGVKLNNCIILESVVIENEVKLENCIISSNAIIKEKAFLKDCEVGNNFVVESNCTLPLIKLDNGHDETLVATSSISENSADSELFCSTNEEEGNNDNNNDEDDDDDDDNNGSGTIFNALGENLRSVRISALFICGTIISISAISATVVYSDSNQAPAAKYPWSFKGIFSSFDHASIRRGYQVYKEVCASCHPMNRLAYRHLVGVSHTLDQAKAEAAAISVTDGPDDEGNMFTRPGKLSDYFPDPYPNKEAARFANSGAYPPDLSIIAKARPQGVDYIFSLLTGYSDPPAGIEVSGTTHFNKYFPGGTISMAQALYDGIVEYEDGTPPTASQMAKDVSTFLAWSAHPETEQRKQMMAKAFIICSALTGLVFYIKRHRWSYLKSKQFVYKPNSKI